MANLSNINNKLLVGTNGEVRIGDTATIANVKLRVKQTAQQWTAQFVNTDSSVAYGISIDTSASSYGAAGTLQCYTNSGGGFIVRNDSKVGIGTTSPDGNLEVIASTTVSGASDSVNNVLIGLQAANRPTIILDTADTTYTNRTWNITNVGSAGSLFFGRNGLDVLVMKNTGNVGIGTASPTDYYPGADNLVIKQASGEGGMSIVTANDTSGAIYFADGTTGSEQYKGGIGYTHSTDKLFLVSGGQTRAWMDTNGNVGIGTDSPFSTAKLQIKTATNRNLAFQTGTTETTGFKINAFNDAANTNIPLELNGSVVLLKTGETEKMRIDSSGYIKTPADKRISVGDWDNSGFTASAAFGFSVQSTTPGLFLKETDIPSRKGFLAMSGGGMYIGGSVDFIALDANNGNRAVTINSSLDVGIGTTSPAMGLHVEDTKGALFGNSGASGSSYFSPSDENTLNGGYGLNTDTADIWLNYRGYQDGFTKFRDTRIGNGKGGVIVMVDGSEGNVGIGTTPETGTLLHLEKNSAANTVTELLRLDCGENSHAAGKGGAIVFRDINVYSDTAKIIAQRVGAGSSSTLQFQLRGSERMRILSGGEVFVGDTTTNYGYSAHHIAKSSSQGYALIVRNSDTSTTNNSVIQLNQATTGTNGYFMICRQGDPNSGTNRLFIFSNGNVQNVNNSYGAISDERLKENIIDATPKLDDLMKVKVRNFNLIGEETKQIGVVAQELEDVFPNMIDESIDFEDKEITDEEGNVSTEKVDLGTTTKSVKYSVFVPMLIKAIQELKAEIDELKK